MTSIDRVNILNKTLENISDEPVSLTLENQLKTFLPENDKNFASERHFLLQELEGHGPLQILLDDKSVTEIMVNAFNEIFYEKNGELFKAELSFANPITFDRVVKKFLTEMDRVADQRHPLVDGTLKDGTRVHVALPPITKNPTLSIRRHSFKEWTLETLCTQKLFSKEVLQTIRNLIRERKTILVCGPTGCGKTTLLRAMILETDESQRTVLIEDTQELSMIRPNVLSLLTRISLDGLVPSVTLNDLLKNALRMRPDRIVIGEMRGDEALIFLDAVSTGHAGSMSSIHGGSGHQALSRLEQLVSRAAPQWSVDSIRKLIFESVDTIICVERKNEGRRVSEIADLTGLESFGFLTESQLL